MTTTKERGTTEPQKRTIRKGGGGWIGKVRDLPGLYGRYKNADGKTVQVKVAPTDDAAGWKVAEDKLADLKSDARRRLPDAQGLRHATLAEFLGDEPDDASASDERVAKSERYFALAESRVGERHMDDIRGRLNDAANHFGKTDIAKISHADADAYFVKLAQRTRSVIVLDANEQPVLDEDGKPKTETRPITVGVLRNHRVALSACWSAAIDRGFATTNPWRRVRLAKTEQFPARLLTRGEVARIVARVRADIRPMIEFLAETGLRLGEAQALTWQRVESKSKLKFNQILVARSKSGRTRTVPCSARAREILATLWDGHVAKATGPDYVFPHFNRHHVWRLFKDACLAAGIGYRVRVHDLRHYVGTSLAQAGVPIPTIMGILGHSQISTTQRYAAHLPGDAAAAAFAALDASRDVVRVPVKVRTKTAAATR
jgi:integrase